MYILNNLNIFQCKIENILLCSSKMELVQSQKYGKKQGFGMSIHNHTDGVPIPSIEDIFNFGMTKQDYGVITAENSKTYTVTKINNPKFNKMTSNIYETYSETFERFYNDKVIYSDYGRKILNNPSISITEKKRLLNKELDNIIKNNPEKIVKEFNNSLNIYGINIKIYINRC